MDKLINSAFDFFAYALPGFCILASFFILDGSLNTSREFIELANKLQVGGAVLLLGLGYAVGFAVTPVGRRLYQWFGGLALFSKYVDKWLDGKLKKYPETFEATNHLFISTKFVMLRELSPANFKYIESWHVYSLMSQNMAVASLVALCLVVCKLFYCTPCIPCNSCIPYDPCAPCNFCHPCDPSFWWKSIPVLLISIVLFLYNAVKFSIWATNDMNSAIVALNMEQRAKHLAEQKVAGSGEAS